MKKALVCFACIMMVALTTRAQENGEGKKPPPPPPPPRIVHVLKPAPPSSWKEAFYKRNPAVIDAYWNNMQYFQVRLRNNTTEEYDFRSREECELFTARYGVLPPPPPPPPPPVIN